jgi:hypothetical protein
MTHKQMSNYFIQFVNANKDTISEFENNRLNWIEIQPHYLDDFIYDTSTEIIIERGGE